MARPKKLKFHGELYHGAMTKFKVKENEVDPENSDDLRFNPYLVDVKIGFDMVPGETRKTMPILNVYGATAEQLNHYTKMLRDAANEIVSIRKMMENKGCIVREP